MKSLEWLKEKINRKNFNTFKKLWISLSLVLTLLSWAKATDNEEIIKRNILLELIKNWNYTEEQIDRIENNIFKSPLSVSKKFLYKPIEKVFYEGEFLKNSKFMLKIYNFELFKENYKYIYNFYVNNWWKSFHKIFIFKSKDFGWKFVLLYYQWNTLKVATFVSPGKRKFKTPIWNFKISEKEEIHFSEQYSNAPMPYSMYLWQWWFYIHSSPKIDGNPRSHGCIRVPLLASKVLYNEVKEDTPVIFMWYDNSF